MRSERFREIRHPIPPQMAVASPSDENSGESDNSYCFVCAENGSRNPECRLNERFHISGEGWEANGTTSWELIVSRRLTRDECDLIAKVWKENEGSLEAVVQALPEDAEPVWMTKMRTV